MTGKLRKLFTSAEIQNAAECAGGNKTAAETLSRLRNVNVSPQLVRYWMKHLDLKKKNGEPYVGTTVLDRNIREEMELREPSLYDDAAVLPARINEDNSRMMVIPDIHSPYHHPDTLEFLSDVQQVVKPTRVINLGDETDQHALSFHDSDPNLDSAGVELASARAFIGGLAGIFPEMDICHSNHGSLVYRRAFKHGIPVEYIKSYRDILFPRGGGDGWSWHEYIRAILPNGDTVLFRHQSSGDILNNAAHEQACIIEGHQHSEFTIRHRSSSANLYWALIGGCLIDRKALAFAYGKLLPKKPIIGCSAIINSQPILIAMPMHPGGGYTGKLEGVL